MIGLLEEKFGRGNYDILMDYDVYMMKGVFDLYDVVFMGCYLEYFSLEFFNVYVVFLCGGGSLMYFGGNGFYWCFVIDLVRL